MSPRFTASPTHHTRSAPVQATVEAAAARPCRTLTDEAEREEREQHDAADRRAEAPAPRTPRACPAGTMPHRLPGRRRLIGAGRGPALGEPPHGPRQGRSEHGQPIDASSRATAGCAGTAAAATATAPPADRNASVRVKASHDVRPRRRRSEEGCRHDTARMRTSEWLKPPGSNEIDGYHRSSATIGAGQRGAEGPAGREVEGHGCRRRPRRCPNNRSGR